MAKTKAKTKVKKPSPLERKIQTYVDKYYGMKMNIVQIYADPKVSNCYIVRFETKKDNFACVINFDYGDDPMIEDGIELEPGQKITYKMFGDPQFF